MYKALLAVIALGLSGTVYALDPSDSLLKLGATRSVITTGDFVIQSSTVCNFGSAVQGATQLIAATTDYSRRRVCFQNQGNQIVKLGTSTIVASDLWALGESTNAATLPIFCTNSSAAFYCGTTIGTSSMTVITSVEKASVP